MVMKNFFKQVNPLNVLDHETHKDKGDVSLFALGFNTMTLDPREYFNLNFPLLSFPRPLYLF